MRFRAILPAFVLPLLVLAGLGVLGSSKPAAAAAKPPAKGSRVLERPVLFRVENVTKGSCPARPTGANTRSEASSPASSAPLR